jgi:hypothetical protein
MDDQFGTHICTSEIGNRAVKLRALLDRVITEIYPVGPALSFLSIFTVPSG